VSSTMTLSRMAEPALLSFSTETWQLRRRMRKTLAFSVIVHALVIIWLVTMHRPDAEPLGIVEIDWLEPAPQPETIVAAPAEAIPAAVTSITDVHPEPQPTPVVARSERFRRELKRSEMVPHPQEATARQDRLDERLATLRRDARTGLAPVAAPDPASRWAIAAAAAPAEVTGPQPGAQDLVRGVATPEAPGLALRREPVASRGPALALSAPVRPRSEAVAASETTPAAALAVAGVTLAGPVANRPVLSHVLPSYPPWASREAIEGTVTLRFTVLPDGRVREGVQVERTAGYADFDDRAVAALLQWRFAPLDGGGARDQWGTITFRYRLKDGP
jgi:TonB family protein